MAFLDDLLAAVAVDRERAHLHPQGRRRRQLLCRLHERPGRLDP
jgi:hypothetical protein